MSHEIRTPMNGIIGMLMLAENKLEANSPAMQYLTKADELRISQVIINFLSNAVKFTSEGEIIVTFRQMMLQNGVADCALCDSDWAWCAWCTGAACNTSALPAGAFADGSFVARKGALS